MTQGVQGPRCLLVDDDQDVLDSLKTFVRLHLPHWSITTEARPTRALLRLMDERPDVIIADMRMPEMDGLEFLRRTRAIAPAARRVLMTAYGRDAAELLARLGDDVDLVLLKPIETMPFLERLRALVQPQRSRAPPPGGPPASSTSKAK